MSASPPFRMRPTVFLFLALAVAASGCDGFSDDDFTPDLVVSAFVGAGEPLPTVRLSETSPFLDRYDPSRLGVGGADVTLTLLAADGSDEVVTRYAPSTTTDGLYFPIGVVPSGLAGRTYRLDVAAGSRQLTATTTVPPALELVSPAEQEVVYGVGAGPGVQVSRSSTSGRQAAFVGSTRALAPSDFDEVTVDGDTRYRSIPGSGFLPTPVYQRFLDCEPEEGGTILCGEDPSGEDVVIGTSPVINEASYINLGDGTILVQIPFIAFGYYGPYRLTLVSLDAAFQAFVQTQAVQLGGTTLSPGEIPNVTTNVEGGLGIFGSYARVQVETTILEPTR